MLRTLILLSLLSPLVLAGFAVAAPTAAASANGSAACPPETAEPSDEAVQPPTGMTTAAGTGPATGPTAAARSSSSSGNTRRTKLRWHAFVPGMFK